MIPPGMAPSAQADFPAVTEDPSIVAKVFLKLPWTEHCPGDAHCQRDLPVLSPLFTVTSGGGMQIILAIIALPEDASLAIMEMKWDLIPDMSGGHLSRLTRIDIAQELTMIGRKFTAREGHEYGLISRLADDPMVASEQLAQTICRQSPDTIAAAKYLFRKTWKADTWKALRWERWVQARLLGRKNQRIAMKNGLGKTDDPMPFIDRRSF